MKTKRLLSVLLALLLILIYVPGAAAEDDGGGIAIQSHGDNWLKVHLRGQTTELGQDINGYAYFDFSSFPPGDENFFRNLKPLPDGANPFTGINDIDPTHYIELHKQGDMVQCHDSGWSLSNNLVGIMITRAVDNAQVVTASLLGSDTVNALLFTDDNYDTSAEGHGSLNVFLKSPYTVPANVTLTKSADPEPDVDSSVKPGDIITYKITAKNDVPWYGKKAYTVNVSDYIPYGTTYVSGSAMLGNNIAQVFFNMFGLNVFVGDLAPQQEQDISFQVKVNDISDDDASTEIANRAYASFAPYRFAPLSFVRSNWVKHTVVEPKIDIEGAKIWDDYENVHGNRPESIIINLYRGLAEDDEGENGSIELTDEETPFDSETIYENGTNEWDFLFTDLNQFDSEGNEYKYWVQEAYAEGDEDAGDLYDTTIEQDEEGLFIITNDYIPEPGIEITKTVANLTTDGPRGATADLEVGDTAGYEITIRNIGDLVIHNVLLRDDMAVIGEEAVDQFDNDHLFIDDGAGVASLEFDYLEPDDEIIISYQHVATTDDVDISPITNTAEITARIFDLNMMPRSLAVSDDNGGIEEGELIPIPVVWSTTVSASASIDVTEPPEDTTTDGTTTGETSAETVPTIDVTTESLPLAEPTPTVLPTIKPISTSVPLATPSTINVEQTQIPKSGENAPLWPIGLALLAIAAGMVLIIHKSKKQTESDDSK